MNLRRNRLSIAIMGVILGGLPLAVFAEIQTSDEILNVAGSGGADIELNNTGAAPNSTADWEICTGGSAASTTCNSVPGALPILNGFHITNKSVNAIGIESGAGSTTTPLLYLDSAERVGINTANPIEELQIESTLPAIRIRDNNAAAGQGVADISVSNNLFFIENTSGSDAIKMELDGGGAQNNQLYLDSTGNVAVGKANPTSGADFEVGGGGNILLENGTEDWAIWTSSAELIFRNGDDTINGSFPFRIENQAPNTNFIMKNNGNIGMGGTFNPEAALHIKRAGGGLIVEDSDAATAVRHLIKMKNNGPVGFEMEDTNLGNAWDFRTAGNGAFLVSNIGVPGSKLQINTDGSVFINGTGFILNGTTNNMTVAGTSTAVQHISSSSRAVKTSFSQVDAKAVLSKIKGLEVTEWRYKDKAAKGRHIGPMAEDFYKLFKLGADDKHVSATDMASIAIIAAKELQNKADIATTESQLLKKQFKEETTRLQAKNNKLQARLESLEKLVMSLASGESILPKEGNEIVLLRAK